MKKLFISLILLFLLFSCNLYTNAQDLNKIVSDAEKQTLVMLNEIDKAGNSIQKNNKAPLVSPRTLNPSGDLKLVSSKDWTSGFFPGILWYLYELTGDEKWEEQARKFTLNIEDQKLNGVTHDMGFKIYCSFGAGFRLTGEATCRDVIIQGAKTLSTRYNDKVGSIRSWDHSTDKWDFPVIIDNMMNLELLFEATRMTGDSSFYKIAVSHANTTLKNHFRPDYFIPRN